LEDSLTRKNKGEKKKKKQKWGALNTKKKGEKKDRSWFFGIGPWERKVYLH